MSDFLDAAKEILTEFGESVSVQNRSGTTTGSAVKVFFDEGLSVRGMWPEFADNAADDSLQTAYLAGDQTLGLGYKLVRSSTTHEIMGLSSPKEGTTVALHIARCRKV